MSVSCGEIDCGGERVYLKIFFTAVVAASFVSCATVTVHGPGGQPITRSYDEFRTYAESVFRLQNGVLDELISATDFATELSTADAAALLAAEQTVVASCQALNQAAIAAADGHASSLSLKLSVLDSIVNCETSALAVKTWLATAAGSLSASSPWIGARRSNSEF
jgi:hypothetical protein